MSPAPIRHANCRGMKELILVEEFCSPVPRWMRSLGILEQSEFLEEFLEVEMAWSDPGSGGL